MATGKGSGSILLNFDQEEPARSISAAPSPSPSPSPQQPGGWDSRRLDTVNSPWQRLCVHACVPGYPPGPEPSHAPAGALLYHEFAVPQHPGTAAVSGVGRGQVRFTDPLVSCPSNGAGLLLHTRGTAGKRERESERDSGGEKDGVACSLNKMQRQSTEVRLLFLTVRWLTR